MDAGKRGRQWEPSASTAGLDASAARNAAAPPPSGPPGDATAGAARARAALAGSSGGGGTATAGGTATSGGTATGAATGPTAGTRAGAPAGSATGPGAWPGAVSRPATPDAGPDAGSDDGLFAAEEAVTASVASGDFEAEAGALAPVGHAARAHAPATDGPAARAAAPGVGADATEGAAPAPGGTAALAPAAGHATAPASAAGHATAPAPAAGRATAPVSAAGHATAPAPAAGRATAPASAADRATAPVSAADRATAPAARPQVPAAPRQGWAGPDMGAPATFVLLRHGETALTPEKRFSGSGGSDPELSAAGLRQAEAVAEALAARGTIQEIVSSPLTRCRQTAGAVAARLGLDVRIEQGLRETDFGAWEGLTFGEVRERHPEDLDAWLASPKAAPTGGGESFATVARRVAATRDRLTAAYAGRTVLLVTHVTPIKTLVRLALGAPPESLFRMELSAASISAVAYYADGNASVRLLNDTSHLRG
ncbi:bifunctional RNase H/acid phosphatase [Streptomyces tanashiensis]